MQISIVLCKERIELPIAAVETVQGLIYRALSEDSKYSDYVHEEGKHFAGRTYKLFTFGDLRGKYEIEGKQIVYRSSVCLDVRSTDAYLIQLLLIYFQKNRTVRLGDNTVSVGSVTLDDTHIFENQLPYI